MCVFFFLLVSTCFYVCRNCSETSPQQKCSLPQWDGNWTLVAVNPLGQYSLTDSAELSHRGRGLHLVAFFPSTDSCKPTSCELVVI